MPQIKHKKQSQLTKRAKARRLYAGVFILVIAAIGAYGVLHSRAENFNPRCYGYAGPLPPECDLQFVPNPTLTRPCGLDVALLIDLSSSMYGKKLANAKEGMRLFVNTLRNTDTYIAVGQIDGPESPLGKPPFTNDTNEVLRRINSFSEGGRSYVGDLWKLHLLAPRSDRPNLIIILSDFGVTYDRNGVGAVKSNGTRILALAYHEKPDEAAGTDHTAMMISGPNMDTGNIFTSDVVHVDPSTIGSQFKMLAQQLCFNGKAPPAAAGHGHGSGGTGTGTNGQGQGQGPGAGAGSGGGGSAANKQQDKPNTVPKAASQGETVEPPKPEPSPFFDGKEYDRGSDGDTLAGTIGKAGKKVANTWPIALAVIILGGITGFGYWKWRQSRNA